ncbi:hypothetical protein K435DRAFT_903032 [Dendrothele bispora CBS 962.96]|uniref:Uncharacterized protein n=1 Tax=Dendrothele bispora (strain CBS 962.96) TaxID=1314807 RepID=A0A4S8KKX5_DENBC|nr:hypothetical protein K435DRAFT_903032 [Dendrothele bispora CBS 962.96]
MDALGAFANLIQCFLEPLSVVMGVVSGVWEESRAEVEVMFGTAFWDTGSDFSSWDMWDLVRGRNRMFLVNVGIGSAGWEFMTFDEFDMAVVASICLGISFVSDQNTFDRSPVDLWVMALNQDEGLATYFSSYGVDPFRDFVVVLACR